jgi:hypothetical protein
MFSWSKFERRFGVADRRFSVEDRGVEDCVDILFRTSASRLPRRVLLETGDGVLDNLAVAISSVCAVKDVEECRIPLFCAAETGREVPAAEEAT